MGLVKKPFEWCSTVGVAQSQEHRSTPLGVCEADLHSEQSFRDGKILRMGHYAKILLARFRFNWGVYQ